MSDSTSPLVQQLAEAAGLAVRWKNYRNEDQVVATETLCRILDALGIEAATEEDCRRSLERLREEERNTIPALLITRSGRALSLPPALQQALGNENELKLINEAGEDRVATLRRIGESVQLLPPEEPGYYRMQVGDQTQELAVAPRSCTSVEELGGSKPAWGLGVQLYSLRREGDGGIGDFSALRQLAEGVALAGAAGLAVSPVHAQFSADRHRFSPYSPSSRLFLNVLHIDPGQTFDREAIAACLRKEGLAEDHARLEALELIDWPEAARVKLALLRALWQLNQAALMDESATLGQEFQRFREQGGEALELHATFEALHAFHFGRDPGQWNWRDWDSRYQDHNGPAVYQFADDHREEVLFHCFLQWLADRGLAEAHAACREAGAAIGLIADLAVGTDSGGSHAWSRKEDMLTGISVGAPPDMLNHQGQDWGLTSFSPRALLAHGYRPMREMLRASLRHAGGLRIDHILGLRRLWLIPEGHPPDQGAYLQFPQEDLLSLVALESWRHKAVIIGEDLGTIPGHFRQDLADTGLLGMGVLWFEKDNGYFVEPARWRATALATTSTHDLPTVSGWWQGRDLEWNVKLDRLPKGCSAEDARRERGEERQALWAAFRFAGLVSDDRAEAPEDSEPVVDAALAFVASTPCSLTLAPLEDLLGLSEQANLPGTIDEHPNWRRRLAQDSDSLLQNPQVEHRLDILNRHRRAAR